VVKQERAERTRETIIRAAASIFEEDGYTAAPLSGITRRATVTKGALYFHFASKRELAQAVVGEATGTLGLLLDEAREAGAARLPLQALIDLTHAVAGRLAADPVLRAGLRLGADTDLYPERGGLAVDWSALVDELLRRPGPAAVPAAARLAALSSVLTGIELLLRRAPGKIEPETLTSVWQLLLPGLADCCGPEGCEPGGTPPRQLSANTRQHTDPSVR
jgi:AcrR family transcriptional regulator